MRKRIIPIVICLAAVAFTSCQAKPMNIDEYRRCREAIYCYYNNMDYVERNVDVFYGDKPYKKLKERAVRICDSLGFTFDRFNQAHKRFGHEGLTYTGEIRLFASISSKHQAETLMDIWSPEYPLLLVDLGIARERLLQVSKDGIRFDGFKTELDSLANVMARYRMIAKRCFTDNDENDPEVQAFIKSCGGVYIKRDSFFEGNLYALTFPPVILLEVESGLLCSRVWPVTNILAHEKVEYLSLRLLNNELNVIECRLTRPLHSDIQWLIDQGCYAGYLIRGPLLITPGDDTQNLVNAARLLRYKQKTELIKLILTAREDLPFNDLFVALDSLKNYMEDPDRYDCYDCYLASPDIYEMYKDKSIPWPDSP